MQVVKSQKKKLIVDYYSLFTSIIFREKALPDSLFAEPHDNLYFHLQLSEADLNLKRKYRKCINKIPENFNDLRR